MSSLKLQERFTLDSPPDVVWRFLVDPVQTVTCLPGAQITGRIDERTYSGTVKVKVGAVRVAYAGNVVFEEVDESARYVRIVGKGRESAGSGSAEMTMESRVVELDGGRTEVTVDSEVRLTGKIVRFGRGMIETIATEILDEFRSRLAERLEAGDTPAPEEEADPAAHGSPAEDVTRAEPAGVASRQEVGRRPRRETPTGTFVLSDEEEDDALPLLPLLLRSLRSWLRRLFGRG